MSLYSQAKAAILGNPVDPEKKPDNQGVTDLFRDITGDSERPYVCLNIGQSGADGFGGAVGGDKTANPMCFAWDQDSAPDVMVAGEQFLPAEFGTAPYNNIGGSQTEEANHYSFHAMKYIQSIRGGQTYLIQIADGSTAIEAWMSDGDLAANGWARHGGDQNLYTYMKNALTAALPLVPGSPATLDCIMVNHGGANEGDSVELYAHKVQVVLDRLVSDGFASYASTKVVLGELVRSGASDGYKGERQLNALRRVANNPDDQHRFDASIVSSIGLAPIDSSNPHLSGEALVEQGYRYGRAALAPSVVYDNVSDPTRFHVNSGLGWLTLSTSKMEPFSRLPRAVGDSPVEVEDGHSLLGSCFVGSANDGKSLNDRLVLPVPMGAVRLSMEVVVDGAGESADFRMAVQEWDKDGTHIGRNTESGTTTVSDTDGRVVVSTVFANPNSSITATDEFSANARYFSAVFRTGVGGDGDEYRFNILGVEFIPEPVA